MHDVQLVFSDNQAVTASGASTNSINLGAPATPPNAPAALERDIGGGLNVPIEVEITEAFNNLTSLRVDVQVSSTSDFSSDVEAIATTAAVSLADLTLGKKLSITTMVPPGANKQYMRLNYTVNGTAPTTGQVWAGIVSAVATNG